MAEWWMTDFEIKLSYCHAKDRIEQVRILAELNVTTPKEIVKKLVAIGALTEEEGQETLHLLRQANPLTLDFEEEERRMELYEQKYSDGAIATLVGATRGAIIAWRRYRGLPGNNPSKTINGVWRHIPTTDSKNKERKEK